MQSLFIDEIAQYLVANGVGTQGTDIFIGNMPDGVDTAIGIFDTIGMADEKDIPLFLPSFQILIRGAELDLIETTAQAIRNLLHNKYNLQFITNGTYVYYCNLVAHGGHIGQDPKGRDLLSLNFQCKVR